MVTYFKILQTGMVSGEAFSRNSSEILGTQFLSVSLISFLHSELHRWSPLQALSSPFITPKLAAIVSERSFSHRIVGERKGVSCPSTRIHPLESSLNDAVQSGSCDVSIGSHQTAPIHDKWVTSPGDIRRV